MSKSSLATWANQKFGVGITQSAIRSILKKSRDLEAMLNVEISAKWPRVTHHPQLDEALATWTNVFAGRLGLRNNASKYSNGWLQRFEERNKSRRICIHGESGAADQAVVDAVLPALLAVIARYELKDVFNMDETGLFHSMVPENTIVKQQIEGRGQAKNRITVAFAASSDGSEKLKPLFIRKVNKLAVSVVRQRATGILLSPQ
ncbi:DNA-binding centromere protein B (CENP-B) [Plasmopara halstedii]|uniref:DNA-binding centromere protein B (CENP-B) n=1 Tax=Plasmopara halstedii TaxID=4781 RepID=A0A0P1AUY7_PLAHL|nr:DNA-binding centromere protein B (CENP-B) [Plasmopara halstedii]CEG45541.1 DNA-binding centromere protein B (CENP-B) [Plasmopara halstedii]|eukprot:XP_024581910.1 DNA-binding centromere protein B (CENP-B) [Plasmopara halstedii]